MLKTASFLDYKIVISSINECVDDIIQSITESNEPRWLACLNPHSYAVAKDDPLFLQALCASDWLVPDGIGVVLASHLLSCSVYERITGSDIFNKLHERLNYKGGGNIFFLGATEDVLTNIRQRMSIDYPNLRVVGTFSPPYKLVYSHEEVKDIISKINTAKPDVLWVGMTAPKQEKWIYLNKDQLDVKFIGAIGAVFDFYAGRVKRSHPIFQRLGLEWLPRLAREPLRLWRRMVISAPIFVIDVLRKKYL